MNEIFNAKSLVRECEKEYTKRYFPNNQVLSLEEYAKEYDLKTVKYYELANSEIWGMPYAVTYNENGSVHIKLPTQGNWPFVVNYNGETYRFILAV